MQKRSITDSCWRSTAGQFVVDESVPEPDFLMGTPVHPVDFTGALGTVAQWVCASIRPRAIIIQATTFSLVNARESPTYRHVLESADLCVPDGMPLVWILRWRGHQNVERVYGPDFMLKLCRRAAEEGWRCFFLGGQPGVAELLANRLVSRFPRLNVVGTFSPPFRQLSMEEDAQMCTMVNAARPDILWIGLGSPKQDVWMYEHREKLNVAVMHGVGAAFDFLSGRVRQAPRWMMNVGLEWLFRLFQEPRRLWKRYTIVNLKFICYLLTSLLRKRG